MIFIALFIVTCLLCYQWIKSHYSYWTKKCLPQIDGSFPFGSMSGVGVKVCMSEKYNEFYEKFKGQYPVIGFYNFFSPAVLIISPEAAKTVLAKEFYSFSSRGLFYNKKDDPVSASLLTLEGNDWKQRRTKLTPTFTTGKIKMMFEIVDMVGDHLTDVLENNLGIQDMRQWAQKYSNDTIGNVAFGLEFGCLKNEKSDVWKFGKRVFHLKFYEIPKILFSTELPDFARMLGFRFIPKESGDFFLNTFLQTLASREKNNIERNDFVALLLKMKDVYTPTELAAEAFIFYIGGFETSSTLISYVIYLLALNQDIQDRLRDEIVEGITSNNDQITYDLIFGFKYLDMVVNETMRIYPPASPIFRKCTKDFEFPDTKFLVKRGMTVIINSYSLHHDPEYFPEPSKFDPERFNDENVKNIRPFTFLPFGEGPRNCIGMRFGQLQSKIAIAKLINSFKFSTCEKTSTPIKFNPSSPFIEAKDGIWLRVEKL